MFVCVHVHFSLFAESERETQALHGNKVTETEGEMFVGDRNMLAWSGEGQRQRPEDNSNGLSLLIHLRPAVI